VSDASRDNRSPASNGGARALGRKLLWPAKRFFDPRFVGLHEALADVKRILVAETNAANEAAMFTGRALDKIHAELDEQRRSLEVVSDRLGAVERYVDFDPDAPHPIGEIDQGMTALLNYAASHEGYAAQANMWFNPPVLVGYAPHEVELRWVNERVAEVPYAFRALSRIEPNAKVLDVGATESSLCLSLATLGYDVTAIDPRPNPLSHERLRTVVGAIENWEEDVTFDAVICLSTIEHIGTGGYGQETADDRTDLAAMKRMRELTRPGGLLVLTTSVGQAGLNDSGRVYDRQGLDELLEGWETQDLTLVQRKDATTWVTTDEPIEDLAPDAETVAMVSATKTAD
jgi:hypothetical protein